MPMAKFYLALKNASTNEKFIIQWAHWNDRQKTREPAARFLLYKYWNARYRGLAFPTWFFVFMAYLPGFGRCWFSQHELETTKNNRH